MSVVAGKLGLRLVWVFAGLHQRTGGVTIIFHLKSQLNFFHLVFGSLSGGELTHFLQQVEVDVLEQLLHSSAGGPAEFVLDGIERDVDRGDLLSEYLADLLEVEDVVAVVVVRQDLRRVVLTSD